MSRTAAAIAPLALLLVACTSMQPGGHKQRPLAPPIAFEASRHLEYSTTIAQHGDTQQILLAVELNEAGLALAAFSELGQPLFSVSYHANGLSVADPARRIAPDMPRQIVADLQVLFWPQQVLSAALASAGWTLQEDGPKRLLLYQGELMTQIETLHGGGQRFEDFSRSYIITMQPVAPAQTR